MERETYAFDRFLIHLLYFLAPLCIIAGGFIEIFYGVWYQGVAVILLGFGLLFLAVAKLLEATA